MKKEFLELTKLDALTAGDGEGFIEGYASTYGTVDFAYDVIMAGAYDEIVANKKLPVMLFNHDDFEIPIGKWTEIKSDEIGLFVKGQINLELEKGKELYSSIKFGSITGMSVRIYPDYDSIEYQSDIRLIKKIIRLPEISIVTFPCNDSARISQVKTEDIYNVRDFEKCLRELGASQKEALTLISKAKSIFKTQSDFEQEKTSAILEKLNKINELMRA